MDNSEQYKDFNTNLFTLRLLITIPLGTISWLGWTSIRLNRRMYEEYNYKQRVMELYHSFKNEITENGTPDQKQALLGIMLSVAGSKPDLGLHEQNLKETLLGVFRKVVDKLPGTTSGK
jgi:hypothetical protein